MVKIKEWIDKHAMLILIICTIISVIISVCYITEINPLVEKEYKIVGKGYENGTGYGWTFVFHNQNYHVTKFVYDSYEIGDYFKCWICR